MSLKILSSFIIETIMKFYSKLDPKWNELESGRWKHGEPSVEWREWLSAVLMPSLIGAMPPSAPPSPQVPLQYQYSVYWDSSNKIRI